MNPNGVHWFGCAEIDYHPLRMGITGLTGEAGIEIWITFPKRFFVAVSDAGVTIIVRLVDRVSASRQTVAIRKVNRLGE